MDIWQKIQQANDEIIDHVIGPRLQVVARLMNRHLKPIPVIGLPITYALQMSIAMVFTFIIVFLGFFVAIANITLWADRGLLRTPPGHRALHLLTFLLPKKSFETIFAQAIADMREEHAEALASGQLWKARWIVWRDHGNLALTFALFLATTLGKKIKVIWTAV